MMVNLEVKIARFVDDHFPGFVECVLVDADGRRHDFIEKGPIVSAANLFTDSVYPQPGYLACTIEQEWTDELGRDLVRICTESPWSIESSEGETRFTVLAQQIERCPRADQNR